MRKEICLETRTKWARRFTKFWGGDLHALLNDAIQSSRPALSRSTRWVSTDTNIEDADTENLIYISLLKRAESLAKQGLISTSAIPENIPSHPRLIAARLNEFITNAIMDSPKRSAPGLSGWRYEHLNEYYYYYYYYQLIQRQIMTLALSSAF